ncbi:MAG TPA: DNA circularization N-terminal domain-containing protein [Kofleriaceae bacterium]|nr:DNA circularization N-terminal domain-containing protein [Kofleriaceae bacterium]
MSWLDGLRKVKFNGKELIGASFRGVPFFVETSERTGGRRMVTHEFPGRDEPFVEDLGRKPATFRVDGYVIGDDYLAQRDALRAALEDTAGPGELVHPYHGVRRAICTNLSVRETRMDGRMAVFAVELAETPAQAPAPTVEPDPAGQVAARADAAVAAAKAELVEQFDPSGLPSFALASAEAALQSAAAGLSAKLAPAVRATQELAALDSQTRLLAAQASSLVRQPADAFDAFGAALTSLGDTAQNAPGAVLNALLDAYGVDLGPPVAATTLTRQREAANQLALVAALRRVMVIEAARLAPRVPYASIEEATAARDRVASQLEEQAASAGDTAYPALVTLRTEVLRAVPGTAVLARIVTITRAMPIPSLVLAYQLYGSVAQEADILARNQIRHPGFVSGELKVLSHDR